MAVPLPSPPPGERVAGGRVRGPLGIQGNNARSKFGAFSPREERAGRELERGEAAPLTLPSPHRMGRDFPEKFRALNP